ncbi:fimbria/pilus periplasmic chaperone, partial [Escherichia coli]|nr:fimbria/pilus periplasmic chaperone [Escherichia coli]
RIIRTGGNFPTDRESLQWLCVKSVPPRAEDKWAEEQDEKGGGKISVRVQVSLNSCIKLLVRPSAVKGHPDDVAGKVTWTKAGNRLKGTNPTPFYINLSELSVGGKVVNEQHYYIAPFSSYEFALPSGVAGKVQWKVVTDYGGVSQPFEAALKG